MNLWITKKQVIHEIHRHNNKIFLKLKEKNRGTQKRVQKVEQMAK